MSYSCFNNNIINIAMTITIENKMTNKATQINNEQLTLLASDGMLVKRPIIETNNKVLVGFKPAEYDLLRIK